ncbi:MAG: Gfo/Idh/MocA family oxidoreductase [Kiritimatiellae bacterium]|nr:Gfo/Idh/MocA family oxidoreductase [Kiritimatiellia bacterium]
MVGGGVGAFIGKVHRAAARFNGDVEFVAGAFSSDPVRSREQGAQLGLDPARAYGSWQEMLAGETALPVDKRADFVSICTPPGSHFEIAKACLGAGFHVMCEKPMTRNAAEAEELAACVARTRRVFGLMHPYVGYPTVKLARDLVARGDLGPVAKVVVQYPQGSFRRIDWTKPLTPRQQWQRDPRVHGISGCMSDIGVHAANLLEYVTGLKIRAVLSDLARFTHGPLDDDGVALLRLEKGARGVLLASKIATGEDNGLRIRVYGEKKALAWREDAPETLTITSPFAPAETWRRGAAYVAAASAAAARGTHLPAAHPEGLHEAVANTYRNFCDTIRARQARRRPTALELDFPNEKSGVRGMRFVEAMVASARDGNTWKKV